MLCRRLPGAMLPGQKCFGLRLDLPRRAHEQLRAIGEELTMLFAVEQVALIGKLTTTVRTGVRRGTSLAL
jgi:hypothetical protein